MTDIAAYRREFVIPGNSFQRQYVCKAGGAAVDLTGYTVRWTAYYGDQSIEKSTANGSLSMPTPSNGTITLTLTTDDTRKVPVGDSMRYQLEIISNDDIQTTILYGDLVGQTGGNNLD